MHIVRDGFMYKNVQIMNILYGLMLITFLHYYPGITHTYTMLY
jgi:hypothetical protein